jgi:hypothetical protein
MALNFAHYRKTNYTDATGGYSSIKKKNNNQKHHGRPMQMRAYNFTLSPSRYNIIGPQGCKR